MLDGFVFRSHLDGAKHALSPEVAMQVQGALGADIARQLDVCPPGGAPRHDVEQACARTTRWARRCLAAKAPEQALFGIVQGGSHVDLRRAHADELGAMPFDGLALGGFSWSVTNTPKRRGRYLRRWVTRVVPGGVEFLVSNVGIVTRPTDLDLEVFAVVARSPDA